MGITYDEWLKFINGPGWAPSMMFSPETELLTGVQAVTKLQ